MEGYRSGRYRGSPSGIIRRHGNNHSIRHWYWSIHFVWYGNILLQIKKFHPNSCYIWRSGYRHWEVQQQRYIPNCRITIKNLLWTDLCFTIDSWGAFTKFGGGLADIRLHSLMEAASAVLENIICAPNMHESNERPYFTATVQRFFTT